MPNGKFRQADVDAAYHGHGRLTAAIVADVVARLALVIVEADLVDVRGRIGYC